MDSAGAIAGPLLALAVIGRFGMRGVFASAAVPGALCVIVAWLGIREVRQASRETGDPHRPRRFAAAAAAAELRSAWTLRLRSGQAREGARPHTSRNPVAP